VASRVTETAATATVTDTAAGIGATMQDRGVQGLSEDLTGLIRRYSVPALLIELGIGYVLGRSPGTERTA
jgi:hypothetical protein